jgi:hypothetical protein
VHIQRILTCGEQCDQRNTAVSSAESVLSSCASVMVSCAGHAGTAVIWVQATACMSVRWTHSRQDLRPRHAAPSVSSGRVAPDCTSLVRLATVPHVCTDKQLQAQTHSHCVKFTWSSRVHVAGALLARRAVHSHSCSLLHVVACVNHVDHPDACRQMCLSPCRALCMAHA